MSLLMVLFMLVTSAQTHASAMEPWIYRQDFETHEVMGWSSYPPIQDTAYEAPFIYPGTIVPGEEGTVLCKVLHPQYDAPQLTGAVKRLRMRLDANSTLSFRYYIKTTVVPAWLGIDLPLANGDRIRARFPALQTNCWTYLSLTLADIMNAAGRSTEAHLDITALAVTARFEHADPDMPIMLGLDDISVTGHRAARFAYDEPKTQALDEWDSEIALRHYRHGDTLSISGTFPHADPKRLTASIARFDYPDDIVKKLNLTKEGNRWRTDKPVSLDPKTFPAGMYVVRLTGMNGKEILAVSKFTFMIIDGRAIADHPRLWFDRNGIESFEASLKREKNTPFLESIRNDAADGRSRLTADFPYDLPAFPTKGWLSSFEPYRTRIATIPQRATANSIVALVDKNEEAANWAETALLSLSAWPTWTHPWMVNRGHKIYLYQYYTTYNLGLTYDMLYDRLTPEERETVRQAFIRNGLEPAYRTYVVGDQCTCNESNWITAAVGGSLAATCAVMEESDDTSRYEPWLSGCLYKLRAHMETVYDGDSGCIEGFGYGYGTMRIYSEILPILERCLNIDFGHMLKDQYEEGYWAADHDAGRYFTFGDARTSTPNMAFAPWLLAKYGDPQLAWFHDLNPPAPAYYTLHTVLYDTDNVPREKPDLTGARHFRETGTVVFRSGPGPEPFVLTFRCGPFGNHQHLDQGTFWLSDGGEVLATELEYSDYYDDPYYQSHVIQPIGHNCILIDHNPQSQRTGDHEEYAIGMSDHARITGFVGGENVAFALGDLSPVYMGNVNTLERGILYLGPRTALIIDRLVTDEGEATMDALFHGQRLDGITTGNDTFAIQAGDAILSAHAMSTTGTPVISASPDPVKLAAITHTPIELPGRVTVTTETRSGRTTSAVFLGGDHTVLHGDNMIVVEVNDARVLINGTDGHARMNGIETDGLCAVTSGNGGALLTAGTVLTVDNDTLISTDCPATVLIEGKRIHYSTDGPSIINVKTDGKVKSITTGGLKVKGWNMDTSTGIISIPVHAGEGVLELEQ